MDTLIRGYIVTEYPGVYSRILLFLGVAFKWQGILQLRYQPPFRTVRARIAVALVVFIKTPINHIFFKSLIIPDFGFELTKTIYLNVFRNWDALCKSTRLYKSCSIPAGNKRKKTINTAFASQHVPLKNRVSDF